MVTAHQTQGPKKHTLPEVCVRVNRRERCVRYWIDRGLKGHKLPAEKDGRQVFVTERALTEFLAATGLTPVAG